MAAAADQVAFLESCDHPNVVRYLGSHRVQNALWILMEHCGGGSVSDVISANGGGLPEPVIAFICAESLKARRPQWEGGGGARHVPRSCLPACAAGPRRFVAPQARARLGCLCLCLPAARR